MKKLILLVFLTLPLILTVGCSSSDDPQPPPEPPSDAEVLAAGWTAFESGDYAEAEAKFNELLGRDALKAEAFDGMGWTNARLNEANRSVGYFISAFTNGADDLDIADQTNAGMAFARHGNEEFFLCLFYAAEVASDWEFAHDPDLDRDDVTLLEAMAHYAEGEFSDSLAKVQELDAGFTADVATVDGRAALAAKIESLSG